MRESVETKNKNIYGKPEISSGHDIAMTSSQWFGAAFFYLINLGRIPMKELWTKKHSRRNLWIGYLVKLIVMVVVVYFVWTYFLV